MVLMLFSLLDSNYISVNTEIERYEITKLIFNISVTNYLNFINSFI
jgi:hypothetical protein